jgi:GYF domain 2
MDAARWYVMLGNESIGPLTNDEFAELARRGSIGPQTAVSPDQSNWAPARSVESLAFPPAPSPVLPTPPMQPDVRPQPAIWKVVAACAIALVVVIVVVKATMPPEPTWFQPPAATSPPTGPSEAATRTLQYWGRVSAIFKTAAASPGVSAFRSSATLVDSLPTQGIDPDAINCALSVSGLLKECADLVESENDPSEKVGQFLTGFYSGWSGDFQPVVHDLESRSDAHKALASHAKNAQQQMVQTRAILSSRYGIEFPPL